MANKFFDSSSMEYVSTSFETSGICIRTHANNTHTSSSISTAVLTIPYIASIHGYSTWHLPIEISIHQKHENMFENQPPSHCHKLPWCSDVSPLPSPPLTTMHTRVSLLDLDHSRKLDGVSEVLELPQPGGTPRQHGHWRRRGRLGGAATPAAAPGLPAHDRRDAHGLIRPGGLVTYIPAT